MDDCATSPTKIIDRYAVDDPAKGIDIALKWIAKHPEYNIFSDPSMWIEKDGYVIPNYDYASLYYSWSMEQAANGNSDILSNAPAAISAALVGAGAAGTTSTTSTNPSPIGATGDIGEDWLKQFGGRPQAYFPTTQGTRYIDQLINGMAYESKVGYVALTQDISLQVSKDVELIHSGAVSSVSWVFFPSPTTGAYGPSGPLYNLLVNNGIQVFSVIP